MATEPTPSPSPARLERTFEAPAELVWELWTTAAGLQEWWAPDGFETRVSELELRPGGELRYTMTAAAPEQIAFVRNLGLPLSNDGKPLVGIMGTAAAVVPKGAKNIPVAKEFLKYSIDPKVLGAYLKGGLGRWMLPIPEIAKSDPFWLKDDPHRTAYTQLTLLGPTIPIHEVFNPAMAQVNSEHLFSVAEFDVMKEGMAPEAAIDKAFKRVEEIFAKYPIEQA